VPVRPEAAGTYPRSSKRTKPTVLTWLFLTWPRIDAIVAEVAFTGWRESIPGDRAVKKELRGVLKQFALPVTAEPFDPE
jgi:hypothetical protein